MRNQNLAAIPASTSNFQGKYEKLPIIGKSHEHGMLHEKFIRDVCEYEAVEFDESNDMLLKKIDDYEKAIGLSKPTISDEDMKRGDLMKR